MMKEQMENRSKTGLVLMVIALAAASRLLPHPYNFTPIAAMALFGGARLDSRVQAFGLTAAALLLSDLLLGLHATMPAVYLAFGLSVLIGAELKNGAGVKKLGLAVLASSTLFFAITNFGTWLLEPGLYPKTLAGLAACYTLAIPFFQTQLLGDVFFAAVIFGGYALLERGLLGAPRRA